MVDWGQNDKSVGTVDWGVNDVAAVPPPMVNDWETALKYPSRVGELVPVPFRDTYERVMGTAQKRDELEEHLVWGLYTADMLREDPLLTWQIEKELIRELHGQEMTPGQAISRAVQNEDMIKRYIQAWNSLVASQEEMPSFWQEMTNRGARGLASVGSAGARTMAGLSVRPLGTPFAPTPPVTKQDREYAEYMKDNARFLWEIAKNPDLVPKRDDLLSKVLGMGVETVPYITGTTAATILAGPIGGFSVGWMVEGNSAYQTALDDGIPEDRAKMIGMGVGVVSGSIEAFGGRAADKLLASATAKIKSKLMRAGAQLTVGSVTEALEEAGQEIAALTGESTYKDIDWDDAVRRTIAAAGGGFAVGGMFKFAGGAIRGITAESPANQRRRALRFAATQGQLTKEFVDELEASIEEGVKKAKAEAGKPIVKPTPTEAVGKPEFVERELETNAPPYTREQDVSDMLGSAGWYKDGRIHTIHVTSDPSIIENRLKEGKPIVVGRGGLDVGDIGGGVYGSAAPQLWTGRAPAKWSFLKTLEPEQKTALASMLRGQVQEQRASKYISQPEADRALRDIGYWEEGKLNDESLTQFAGQPYNIKFWSPKTLESLGIEPGKQPQEVEMELEGKFARVEKHLSEAEVKELREAGYDGAFLSGGFVSYPQIVVWNNAAVKKFGEFVAKPPTEAVGEKAELTARKGYSYRAFDKASEAVGKDVSVGRENIEWYEGQPFLIEMRGKPGEAIEHHPGAARGDVTGAEVTRVYYNPDQILPEHQQEYFGPQADSEH
jgi:hypothetical protein